MSVELLGGAVGDAFAIPGGAARLHERGLSVSGAGGEALVRFAFPMLGRPHIVTGDPAAGPLLAADALAFDLGEGQLDRLAPLIQGALAGRLALLPTGQPADPVPLTAQQTAAIRHAEGGRIRYGMALSAAQLPERQLYDIAVLGGGGAWQRVAPHAVYRRENWSDFGIAHITDVHVARRIDSFRRLLREAGRHEAADRLINWNDRFRGFIRYANYLHRIGVLDVILATGDLVDYLYEDDDDPAGGGNAAFLRELILGRAPGPEFPDVEELRVPIFLVPGNHDYRKHPYKLIFDLNIVADITRVRNFSGYHLLVDDAILLGNRLDGRTDDDVPNLDEDEAARMVAIEPEMAAYRSFLADVGPYVVRLGVHRIVMLDTAYDVGMLTDIKDGLRKLLGMLNDDEKTFVAGSPNSEGIAPDELQAVADTLAEMPDAGLLIVGLHAPLFNLWHSENPYFLRETQRPSQSAQVYGFLARHDGGVQQLPLETTVERRHPSWFAAERDHRAPTFVKRVDSGDFMDYGVARGHAEELTRLLAGIGARRPADVVLSGHIHRHAEFRLAPMHTGELAYFMDYYTRNPAQDYPTPFVRQWRNLGSPRPGSPVVAPIAGTTYVEVVPGAAPDATPWPMPYPAHAGFQLQVPPYPNPLAGAPDSGAWWSAHRPLVLQTGALGPMESSQVSFSGFRLLSVRNNLIERIHFVASAALEARQYQLPWEEAIQPAPLRYHRYRPRSRGLAAPVGAPAGVDLAAQGVARVVYRDSAGHIHELWQRGDEAGATNLTLAVGSAPRAAGAPTIYADPAHGAAITLYRGGDGHVHSLYWNGGAVGHDALSAVAGGPRAVGEPSGYVGAGGYTNVVYRSRDGHLQILWWHGIEPVRHDDLTAGSQTPRAAGDPAAFVNTLSGHNIVVYRGVDGHIHSLYWTNGPTGHDNLSGVAGSPLAVGDPLAYYTPFNNGHQVTYRSRDGHLHEIYWVGEERVGHWDLTLAAGGATPAASDPVGFYNTAANTKHVFYRGVDDRLHELWWVPAGSMPTHVDLTAYALAPLAADRPAAFFVPGPNTKHIVYRGIDGQLHEIRWV